MLICDTCGHPENNDRRFADKKHYKERCVECLNAQIKINWELNQERKGKRPNENKKLLVEDKRRCKKCDCIKEIKCFSKNKYLSFFTVCDECIANIKNRVCDTCGEPEGKDRLFCKSIKSRCNECFNKLTRASWLRLQESNGREVFVFNKLFDKGLKECTRCKEIKELDCFSFRKGKKRRSTCKVCDKELNEISEQKHKIKINAARRERRKKPEIGIILSQRARQSSLFKKEAKQFKSATLVREWLDCSVEECKIHLEGLFKEGMTWDNRGCGLGKWQIDHIIPVSLSEVNDGKILDTAWNKKIWNYKNLQPLWAVDNAKKSNSYYGDTLASTK
jgi:hypothetical protein